MPAYTYVGTPSSINYNFFNLKCVSDTGELSVTVFRDSVFDNKSNSVTIFLNTEYYVISVSSGNTHTFSLTYGDKLYLASNYNDGHSYGIRFSGSGTFDCGGNICSLYDQSMTHGDTIPDKLGFTSMFNGMQIRTPPILPATNLTEDCYLNLFMNNTTMTTAPALPATVVPDKAYRYMFYGCTSLKNPPELPAMNLGESCYAYMFGGCTSLTTIPDLPATVLPEYCYYRMFANCSLINIANKYVENKCTKEIAFPPTKNATTYADNSTSGMFANVGYALEATSPIVNNTYYIKGESSRWIKATYNGSIISKVVKMLPIDIKYGDTKLVTIDSSGTKTLNCNNKLMVSNVTLGSTTFNCENLIMNSDLTFTITT